MAMRQKHIFARNKPLVNIYSSLDYEGKEVEVREDAEQLVKYHEIVEALLAAGYYRAQLQGLSAFDKIVGGMTWCIEVCDIDVDVNLLFEENLTIGKKIALTEKIVGVLPSLHCPYIIEPHQIQGLDFINIFPLIQWLIKYSDEFREAKEDELLKFAVMQYDKSYIFESDRNDFLQEEQLLRNLSSIQNLYKPCRVRKRNGPLPASKLEQVNSTLSEYDQRMLMHSSPQNDESNKDEGLEFLYDYEKTLADPSKITVVANIYDKEQGITEDDVSDRKLHYAILQSELSGEVSQVLEESEKAKYTEEVATLKKMLETLEKELTVLKDSHKSRLEDGKRSLVEKVSSLQILNDTVLKLRKNKAFSNKDIKEFHRRLKDITKERDELQQIIQHKTKQGLQLENTLKCINDPNNKVEEQPLSASEIKEYDEKEEKIKKYLGDLRLELAKLNREVLGLTMAIDDVPGQAELLQYERRFIELYDQVAAKHKETKQFYTFYNTLFEVKLYTSKELSLLNSILENYEEAMSSSKKREQFMSQLESIVEWVKQTVKKVDQKYNDEKEKKAALTTEYSHLLELQRQYMFALKKLAEERRRMRQLLSSS